VKYISKELPITSNIDVIFLSWMLWFFLETCKSYIGYIHDSARGLVSSCDW